jgi:hypothetical protein
LKEKSLKDNVPDRKCNVENVNQYYSIIILSCFGTSWNVPLEQSSLRTRITSDKFSYRKS